MTNPYIDTDVIIRLLTGDDPTKQETAARLFERVEQGSLTISAPDTVIADAVYVLSSPRLYKHSRQEVASLLTPLVRLPGFHIKNRRTVLAALTLYGYGQTKLDFGDSMIVAFMQQSSSQTIYSFDADFDKVSGISRQEP